MLAALELLDEEIFALELFDVDDEWLDELEPEFVCEAFDEYALFVGTAITFVSSVALTTVTPAAVAFAIVETRPSASPHIMLNKI